MEPALLQQNPNFLERDLKETKDVFLQWAGALQAVFTIYQLQVGRFLMAGHAHQLGTLIKCLGMCVDQRCIVAKQGPTLPDDIV